MTKVPETIPPPIDNEVLKGAMVDGLRVALGPDYIIIDGIIHAPRSDKTVVVTRTLVPVRVLPTLIDTLNRVLEASKKATLTTRTGKETIRVGP